MTFAAYIRVIESVVEPTDAQNLTLVTVASLIGAETNGDQFEIDGQQQVVANKREDGSWRWQPGEMCVYIPENAIIPDEILQQRGYWDTEKNKGLLAGSKNNRVKGRAFAKSEANPEGYMSKGLLFKVEKDGYDLYVTHPSKERLKVEGGDDVTSFFDLKEYVAQ